MKGRCNSRTINGYSEIPRLRSEQAPLFCHCEHLKGAWQSRPGPGLSKSDYRAAEVDIGCLHFQGHHTNQAYYKSGIMSPEYFVQCHTNSKCDILVLR